ncbi:17066_t:CDS:2 [Gigaspora rosea]|nr:17066_t:CDS:2 [Gigaspora rosea]
MYERIEFYVNTVKIKPLQIQRALRKEFPDHEVYLSEIHKAIENITIFTTGIQSTTRIESYNAQVKRLVLNSNISLLELAEALEASIEEKIKKAKYTYWKTQIPLISSAATLLQTLFPELDKALNRFITTEIQKIQRAEIKSCLNYHATAIAKDEMIKYQEVYTVLYCFFRNNVAK